MAAPCGPAKFWEETFKKADSATKGRITAVHNVASRIVRLQGYFAVRHSENWTPKLLRWYPALHNRKFRSEERRPTPPPRRGVVVPGGSEYAAWADCAGRAAGCTVHPQPAGWLVMAAWLVLLRSRWLLPAASPAEEAGDHSANQPPDREHALVAAQALAAWLDRRPQLGIDVFARGQPEMVGTELDFRHEVDVIEFLWACLAQFEDDAESIGTTTLYRPARLAIWAVPDARARILQLLAEASDDAPLERFLPALDAQADTATPTPLSLRRRSAVASTLIAGLELAREGMVTLHQPVPFAPITLRAWALEQIAGLSTIQPLVS